MNPPVDLRTMVRTRVYWTAFAVGIGIGSSRAVLARMQMVYGQPSGAPGAQPAWVLVAATTLMAVVATLRSRDNKWFYAVPAGVIVSSVIASLFL
jgi:hypothetical protein